MLVGLSSSLSYAESGLVFPSGSAVTLSWQTSGDTITVTISNQNGTPVNDLFVTDYTDSPVQLIECRVDNNPTAIATESIEGSVYAGKYTNRWVIGTITQSVQLKYVGYSGNLSFSAAHPSGLFGVMSLATIGPPQNVGWTQ
jgi:hypothetical protein